MANQETTQVIMLAVLYTKQDFDYQLEAVRGPPCQVMLLCTCQLLGQCGREALCVGAHQEVRRVHFPGCPGQLQQELGARSAEKVVEVFWIWLLIVCQWYPDITIAGVRSVLWLWQSASWMCLAPCTMYTPSSQRWGWTCPKISTTFHIAIPLHSHPSSTGLCKFLHRAVSLCIRHHPFLSSNMQRSYRLKEETTSRRVSVILINFSESEYYQHSSIASGTIKKTM